MLGMVNSHIRDNLDGQDVDLAVMLELHTGPSGQGRATYFGNLARGNNGIEELDRVRYQVPEGGRHGKKWRGVAVESRR